MYPDKLFLGLTFYDLFLMTGMLSALLLGDKLGQKRGFSVKLQKILLIATSCGLLFGLFGAVLFQAFYNFMDTGKFELNADTGMTFYGGLLLGAGIFLLIWFVIGKKVCKDEPKKHFKDVADIAACVIPLAHGFGRLGCFTAGCCHGKATDAWYGVAMDFAGGAKVVPVQLFEAIFLFALSAVLFTVFFKRREEKRFPLLPIYCVGYGVWRFFIEYARSDYRGESLLSFLTPSQLIAVILIIVGIVYFTLWYLIKNKKILKKDRQEDQ